MATASGKDGLDVYKFHSTGIVELCAEVTDLVRAGTVEKWGYDLDSAQYLKDDYRHIVRFRPKEEEEKR